MWLQIFVARFCYFKYFRFYCRIQFSDFLDSSWSLRLVSKYFYCWFRIPFSLGLIGRTAEAMLFWGPCLIPCELWVLPPKLVGTGIISVLCEIWEWLAYCFLVFFLPSSSLLPHVYRSVFSQKFEELSLPFSRAFCHSPLVRLTNLRSSLTPNSKGLPVSSWILPPCRATWDLPPGRKLSQS